jgi:hypothetical protein
MCFSTDAGVLIYLRIKDKKDYDLLQLKATYSYDLSVNSGSILFEEGMYTKSALTYNGPFEWDVDLLVFKETFLTFD